MFDNSKVRSGDEITGFACATESVDVGGLRLRHFPKKFGRARSWRSERSRRRRAMLRRLPAVGRAAASRQLTTSSHALLLAPPRLAPVIVTPALHSVHPLCRLVELQKRPSLVLQSYRKASIPPPPELVELDGRPHNLRGFLRLLFRAAWLGVLLLPPLVLLLPALLLDSAASAKWQARFEDCLLRALERGGPCLTKLGQWASTRPDSMCAESNTKPLSCETCIPSGESQTSILATHHHSSPPAIAVCDARLAAPPRPRAPARPHQGYNP